MDSIQTLTEKLSQYNILNYLLPGTILSVIIQYVIGIQVIPDNSFEALVVFYFIGMLNSRIGSLMVEPFLQFIHFVSYEPYNNYIKAEKKDSKISILIQENNTYRSYIAMSFLALLVYVYNQTLRTCECIAENEHWILLLIILCIFLRSYRKQTDYVKKRVQRALKEE